MTARASDNSYRSILKSTSLFGGFKLFEILINVLRGKFVAMILGPAGMGVSSLFVTSSATIQRMASLGLNTAIVKDISRADGDSEAHVAAVIAASRRLLMATALIGAIICAGAAPWLSEFTFGSDKYTWSFALLGVFVFFSILSAGEMSFLQGLRHNRRLVQSSVVGSLTGLFVGVPLYYIWGTSGIVPAMCVIALSTFSCNYISMRKVRPDTPARFSWTAHRHIVKTLVLTGLVLVTNDVTSSLCTYLINTYIRFRSDLSEVGLYQAANSMTMQYAGIVFSAIIMDYLPRLSAVADNNILLRRVVNRQSEIVAYVTAPLLCLLIIFSPLAVRILLADSFMPVVTLMRWMCLGVIMRALMLPMGYIAFAKDNRRLFFWLEGVGGNTLTLVLSIGLYHYYGLMGLAYALVADNALCIIIYYVINRNYYRYRFSRRAMVAYIFAILSGLSVLMMSAIGHTALSYTLMGVTCAAVCLTAFIRLKKLIKR